MLTSLGVFVSPGQGEAGTYILSLTLCRQGLPLPCDTCKIHRYMQKTNRPLVSVVVLNWNGQRFIAPFMTSFAKQTYPKESMELLFVDNSSTDHSLEYLKKHYSDDTRIRIVLNNKNYGYAGGNNLGIKQAKGDYILVCNNDLELDKNTVSELVIASQKHNSDVTTVKLMFLNKPGIINNAGSRLVPDSTWPTYEIGINERDKGQYNEDREITAFCGACVLFTRHFLTTVGLFDKRFFMYFEDGDLAWRGQKSGHKYYYAAKAVAYHVHTGSSSEGSPLFNHFVGRNRLLIMLKNANFSIFLRTCGVTFKDHVMFRLKNLYASLFGRYNKRQALRELLLSQKMLLSALVLSPYILLKRFGLIREEKL